MNMNAGYIQAQHGAGYSYIDENPNAQLIILQSKTRHMGMKNSEYDQEIPQSQTAEKSVAS